MYHLFELRPYKTGELNCYPNITKEQFYSWVADCCINWRSVLYIIEEKSKDDKQKILRLIDELILKEFHFDERSLYPSDNTKTFALYKHTERDVIKCTNTESKDWFFMTTCFPDFIDWLKDQMKFYVQDLDNNLEFEL